MFKITKLQIICIYDCLLACNVRAKALKKSLASMFAKKKKCRQEVSLTRKYISSRLKGVTYQKLVSRLLKKFPYFFENQRFITVFVTARLVSSSSATYIESTPSQHISLRAILVLFSHIRLGIPNGRLSSSFFKRTLNPFLFCPVLNP